MGDRRIDAQNHVEAFNSAVRSMSFEQFSQRFTDDAVMRFVGIPMGPFVGRDAISAAYRAQPPDDVMSLLEMTAIDNGVHARFQWSAGGTGTMSITFRDALVAELVIEFDSGN